MNPEKERIRQHHLKSSNWKKWGPYLSHRSWGTVREDYSQNSEPWQSFTHDMAQSKVFRWSEEGIAGISDRDQFICFSLALWNYQDPILKERFFGLSGKEGNHGEDLKEYYFYLDSTPTHSYMKMLYKYPLESFPYDKIRAANKRLSFQDPEYELLDTGIFDGNYYLDVFIEYAKASEEDLLIQFTVIHRGDKPASYLLLPTIWFRNIWSWGYDKGPMGDMKKKPILRQNKHDDILELVSQEDTYYLAAEGQPEWIFTENETNFSQLYGVPNQSCYTKDAFQRYLIKNEQGAVNPLLTGTKAAAVYQKQIAPGETQIFRLRLSNRRPKEPFSDFEAVLEQRKQEADQFYESLQNPRLNPEEKLIQRQAFAGMLWNKQLYYFDVNQWLLGDPVLPLSKNHRQNIRNKGWENLVNFDIISMPDKWEYPWYASWDLAFHCIPLVLLDPDFAKRQLLLMTREWYEHPNGQLPSYEWNFSDVNPPVHAWASWRAYKIEKKMSGQADLAFLKSVYNKLLLNFTWWVNKKDQQGKNVFQGGFLGMDNISLFDRSSLPFGGCIDQADATSWMGFYCIVMMKISLELAREDFTYQDMAAKFFEHFLRIATAMTQPLDDNPALWEKEDGFFYDVLHQPNQPSRHLKVRSLVGLLPLLSVETIEEDVLEQMPIFKRRMEWFLSKKPELSRNVTCIHTAGNKNRRMMAFVNRGMLISILRYMLDENEFLSEYGIRSLSKFHKKNPYRYKIQAQTFSVQYEPADSESGLFGGNSNWRGPIWFPINFLIIEALQKFHHYYGETLKVEFPTRSGHLMTLAEVSQEISKRLIRLFLKNEDGRRPIYGDCDKLQNDPHWNSHLLFHEFFHADHGKGLGASHQTGWTGLIAKLLQQCEGNL